MQHAPPNLKVTALSDTKKRCFQFARPKNQLRAFMQNSESQNCLEEGKTL